jgi:hypothetical protein
VPRAAGLGERAVQAVVVTADERQREAGRVGVERQAFEELGGGRPECVRMLS